MMASWLSQGGECDELTWSVAGLLTVDSVRDWVTDGVCAVAEMLTGEIEFMVSVQVKNVAIYDGSGRKNRVESRRYYFSQLAHLTA